MSHQSKRRRFEYSQLSSSRSIRLLKLHSAASLTAPIVCSLEEVSLDELPSYNALPYTWESQKLCCSIDCSGLELFTTLNCMAALRQLRQAREPVVLWVDSLCVDQISILERNQQVALMGEIYKYAETVIAWLGEGNRTIEIAIERVKELMVFDRMSEEKYSSIVSERIRKLCIDVTEKSMDLISPLFDSSWFYRLWTAQEVSLASPSNVEVRCGDSTINWIELMGASVELENYIYAPIAEATTLQMYLGSWITHHQTFHPDLLQSSESEDPATPSISYVLTLGRRKACTDPKDKIFALLGVLNALGLSSMTPDYSKSVEDIYREAAQLAINSEKNLDVLFQVSSPNRRPELLSWTPD